jgi:hypothetical protein
MAGGHNYSGSLALIGSTTMIDALALWMSGQVDRAALKPRRDSELEQLARDLDISANELHYLISSAPDCDIIQLSAMLKALGIDETSLGRVQPALLRTLRRQCAKCPVIGKCRYSLDQNVAAQEYEEFCPNAAILTAYRPMHEAKPSF